RLAAMAVPKYRPDCAAAAPSVLAAAFAEGITITAPVAAMAATVPPISSRNLNERLRGESAERAGELVATVASFLGSGSRTPSTTPAPAAAAARAYRDRWIA
ncbi:hypothetical protein, partial [Micromonospora sp. HK10]|uniref:hypothetical protein n=1 Tax=Micromonospora sp. HK10 TaxID=1538294 RepID=UPI001E491B5D